MFDKTPRLLAILIATMVLAPAASASIFDVTLRTLTSADFTVAGSGLPAGTSFAFGPAPGDPTALGPNDFVLVQDFDTIFADLPPLDGLSDASGGPTGLGIGLNPFPDADTNYVLTIDPGAAPDVFAGVPTAGVYDWTLSYYTLSGGLFDSIVATIMKGDLTVISPSQSVLTVAEGIEWFVSPVTDPATGTDFRGGAALVDFSALALTDLGGGAHRLTAIPLPGTPALLAIGLACWSAVRRRRVGN